MENVATHITLGNQKDIKILSEKTVSKRNELSPTRRRMHYALGLVVFMALFTGVQMKGFSQTPKETLHAQLTEDHLKAKEKAAILKDDKVTTKEEKQAHVKETEKRLAEAKEHHAALEKITKDHKEIHTAIKKHHAEAVVHQKELAKEIAKVSPDAIKTKAHAAKLHASVEKAEKEHEKLKEKSN